MKCRTKVTENQGSVLQLQRMKWAHKKAAYGRKLEKQNRLEARNAYRLAVGLPAIKGNK